MWGQPCAKFTPSLTAAPHCRPSLRPSPLCDTFERSVSLLRDLLLFRDVVHNLGRMAVGIMRAA
jgi:hypothetical protein